MAKYQYRVAGLFDWASSNGNALIALQNKADSGKRLTIRSLEIETNRLKIFSIPESIKMVHGRGTGTDGTLVPVAALDTAISMPSGITVKVGGVFDVTDVIGVVNTLGGGINPAVALMYPGGFTAPKHPNNFMGGCWCVGKSKSSSPNEGIVVAPGESYGISCYLSTNGNPPISYTITIKAGGGTFIATAQSQTSGLGQAPVWIHNGSASSITIMEWGATQLGSYSVSPYLQVVPFSGIPLESVNTAKEAPKAEPMDSNSPAASTWINLFQDVPLTPLGAPIQYASDIGGGAPKGFNYLATKDFLGPTFRSLLMECSQYSTGTPDGRGFDWPAEGKDIGIKYGGGIIIRPGEGIAVAIAAETAVSTSAVLLAGYNPIFVAIVFDVDNLIQPYLTINNLQVGSDIVVLAPGTNTEYASVDSIGGTTYSLAYDPDAFQSVDICVYKTGYVPFIIRNLNIGTLGVSVPAAQVIDRAYLNPT